ncbi:hypothetical protein [Polaromonas naphthalenivorans]|uniref:Uncharacterized protein n=1 Tax=Polaromonas naphthalenivorans (strain CJ2) TaxID=365044 RepID=A1VUA3_POLNA|nr:hypothetical protein [Polaromonas naphthalenivorans]ABM39231.1 hypothetical protein Pnap_3935 [Polaromonas naphthalenivorans CJ2]
MKNQTCALGIRFSISIMLVLAMPTLVIAASPSKISCQGKIHPEITKNIDGALDSEALLNTAMKGKKYGLNQVASVASLETNLVQLHGGKVSLKSINSNEGRDAVKRVALLIENNYVIAARMAISASRTKKNHTRAAVWLCVKLCS